MKTKAKLQKTHLELDTYMTLIQRLPLKPIKNDDQHERAVEIIGELIGRKLDVGASDYLDTLILLVNKYEDEHHTPSGVDLSPQEALRAIMTANGLSQAQMGTIIGSESAVSMFLNGERGLSKAHIKAVAARFHVDAGLFL
jgi:HTH-type transcriptional regulator/antitoxin HigA